MPSDKQAIRTAMKKYDDVPTPYYMMSVSVAQGMVTFLDKVSWKGLFGTSRSEIVRHALAEFLDKHFPGWEREAWK